MIVQFLPFSSPVIGVPMSIFMANFGEGISNPTSAMLVGGVPTPWVGTHRPSASIAPLPPSTQVVQPPASSHVVYPSSGVVIRIHSAPFAFHSFMHTNPSGPSDPPHLFRDSCGMGGIFHYPLLM